MKSRPLALFAILLLVVAFGAASRAFAAKTVDEYVSGAKALAGAGNLADAIAMLKEGAAAYPESPAILAYLGLYVGQTSGQQGANYGEAMRLMNESYGYLDKAVELGPENPLGYFYRGIMSVSVPVFLGKLPAGIADLQQVIAIHDKAPAAVPTEMLVTAYSMLGKGYEAGANPADARTAYEQVVKLAPGTEAAKTAEARLAAIGTTVRKVWPPFLTPRPDDTPDISALKKRIDAEPKDAAAYLELARAYIKADRFDDARGTLNAHNEVDPKSAEAYRLLYQVDGALAQKGYDPKIAEDTNYRTNLAFESMSAIEKVVELAPEDVEARLTRGVTGISMPFFIGKFDQGITDLEWVLAHTKSAADSATAMFWLGAARERQAMKYWLNVATKFPKSEAARMSLDAMKPVEPDFDIAKAGKPLVVVDFVLGFRDELAPQIAVWIEDASEKYVRTVFVSGFAGNVKGKQVTLPVWAAVSEFQGVDAVTGASIDVGHHIYTWDCMGLDGKPVKPGAYTVKVEVSHWPSMKYQMAEAAVTVGKKENEARAESGDVIPSLVVTYYPK